MPTTPQDSRNLDVELLTANLRLLENLVQSPIVSAENKQRYREQITSARAKLEKIRTGQK